MSAHASASHFPGIDVVPTISVYQARGKAHGIETRVGLGTAGALAGAKYQWRGDDLSIFAAALALDVQGGVFPILPIFAIWGQGTLSMPMNYRIHPRWQVYGAPGVGGVIGLYASMFAEPREGGGFGMTLSQNLGVLFDYSERLSLGFDLYAAAIPLGEHSLDLPLWGYYGANVGFIWRRFP